MDAAGLAGYLERMEVEAEHYLVDQGDAPCGLYFVEAGQVTAQRQGQDGRLVRLRKMGPGTVVGEMGLYLGAPASESVVTNEPSTLYFLSAEALRRMEAGEPELAVALHRTIAQLLGERLSRANDTLHALLSDEREPVCETGLVAERQ